MWMPALASVRSWVQRCGFCNANRSFRFKSFSTPRACLSMSSVLLSSWLLVRARFKVLFKDPWSLQSCLKSKIPSIPATAAPEGPASTHPSGLDPSQTEVDGQTAPVVATWSVFHSSHDTAPIRVPGYTAQRHGHRHSVLPFRLASGSLMLSCSSREFCVLFLHCDEIGRRARKGEDLLQINHYVSTSWQSNSLLIGVRR